jgi:hypothetical protein
MAKVHLHQLLKQLRGAIGDLVFRSTHNGKTSVYAKPEMSRVKWSPAQVAHREYMAESIAYAKAAMAKPELRGFYVKMAMEVKGNNRPFDMALKHYYDGSNLLGNEFRWDVEHWRAMKKYRKRKKR